MENPNVQVGGTPSFSWICLMCSLDWVYIDLKIKNPRKHILFNKNEIFVICDFVVKFTHSPKEHSHHYQHDLNVCVGAVFQTALIVCHFKPEGPTFCMKQWKLKHVRTTRPCQNGYLFHLVELSL